MAFRVQEEADRGLARAFQKLVPQLGSHQQKEEAREAILKVSEEHGPVIDAYPIWHPFVKSAVTNNYFLTTPERENGFKGMDHTIFFANAFITCPYDGGEEILLSVKKLKQDFDVPIYARKMETMLYHPKATAVLVWVGVGADDYLNEDMTYRKRIAIALMLERVVPDWRNAQVAETWDTMRPYLLGAPHGARSSMFVDQETGQSMKTLWNTIINTGMYGPVRDY
ncbi:hypothetical protein ACKS9G_001986 [Cronobacter turicensis]